MAEESDYNKTSVKRKIDDIVNSDEEENAGKKQPKNLEAGMIPTMVRAETTTDSAVTMLSQQGVETIHIENSKNAFISLVENVVSRFQKELQEDARNIAIQFEGSDFDLETLAQRVHNIITYVSQPKERGVRDDLMREKDSIQEADAVQGQSDRSVAEKQTQAPFFADPLAILRALPSGIVANCIYRFAVRVIKDRDHLISAVDQYYHESEDDGYRRRYPIGQWDVELVTDFSMVFDAERNPELQTFNEDLSSWNVGNGTTFENMFYGCSMFNSDLSKWTVSNATNLGCMFGECRSFHSDVADWDVAMRLT